MIVKNVVYIYTSDESLKCKEFKGAGLSEMDVEIPENEITCFSSFEECEEVLKKTGKTERELSPCFIEEIGILSLPHEDFLVELHSERIMGDQMILLLMDGDEEEENQKHVKQKHRVSLV